MGCGCGKAQAGQVQVAAGVKEPLPASLAAASRGRFQSALPPSSEGRRDFARIFFANERKIFLITKGMPSMRPLQPALGPSSAHIGDLNEQVVERAEALFTERFVQQLSQAMETAPDPGVMELLCHRAMAAMTVNVGFDFAVQMKLMPAFLQPFFLIVVLGDSDCSPLLGGQLEARAATYGFVAESPTQVAGDRPESKRTPFCVRLLSQDLLTGSEDKVKNNWEVEYSVRTVQSATIQKAVEMEMQSVRDAINASRWELML